MKTVLTGLMAFVVLLGSTAMAQDASAICGYGNKGDQRKQVLDAVAQAALIREGGNYL